MGPKEPGAVFVDAISGQHVSSDPQSILQQRRLTFSKDYGWQYDVWVEDPLKYALSGANSRFVGCLCALAEVHFLLAGLHSHRPGIVYYQPNSVKQQPVVHPTLVSS